ncbi:hypothetical protein BDW02DRAFT_626702 [Decorospora gaudefroyi]|uniref:Uncharacterized protein n=1 Tax=Decorospora gaudefroyi TaxID=184978 RepID=A0A6A5KW44_9PLEO|nr:hypothetical protein BDW02DRAFT_626702 [Decorospora gaudefroyi]
MNIPSLLSPIHSTSSSARGMGASGVNTVHTSGNVVQIPESESDCEDEEDEGDEESEERFDFVGEDSDEDTSEYSDVDEAARTGCGIESRLCMDLNELSQNGSSSKLDETLAFWNDCNARSARAGKAFLIDLLHKEYTQQALKLASLKGPDRPLVLSVEQACEKAGFTVLLASSGETTRKFVRTGLLDYEDEDLFSEHEIGEVLEDEWYLTRVYDTEGHIVSGKIEIYEESFLEGHRLKTIEPDEEDYPSGYDSFCGDLVTLWYRSAVMIIVPRACLLDLLGAEPGMQYVSEEKPRKDINLYINIRYLITKMTQTQDSIYSDHFITICTRIFELHSLEHVDLERLVPDWFCPDLLVGAISLKNAQLCEQIMTAFRAPESWTEYSLLAEVTPPDEIDEYMQVEPLTTEAERDAFLSLVMYPECWISGDSNPVNALQPKPPLVTLEKQEAFLDRMRSCCYYVSKECMPSEERIVDVLEYDNHSEISRLVNAIVASQGMKRSAEGAAEGLPPLKRPALEFQAGRKIGLAR